LALSDDSIQEVDQLDQMDLQAQNLTKRIIMAANPIPPPPKKSGKPLQVNLYEAKTQLSSLVERAAKGEEIIIAKAGKPLARLIAVEEKAEPPREWGKNLLGITYIAEDFDAPLPEDVLKDFGL
jgi:prevent-host-death family protein